MTLAACAKLVQFGSRLLVGPPVRTVVDPFSVSKRLVGPALTGTWAVYAPFRHPSGVLDDVDGERRVVATALTGVGVVTIVGRCYGPRVGVIELL